MQPIPPPTAFEADIQNAYQLLSQVRMRTGILSTSVHSCMDKCLDLTGLGETTKKVKSVNRVAEEEKEKKCLEFCSMKWDELYRRSNQVLTKREITSIQTEMFNQMREKAQAQMEALQR
mmetsp:Transcript_24738/g.38552  ORF Transcript_24738/g.38552 Transcript_24738/m.38552 type:complete len:119 (-) Transcript_24738:19-375(-)